MVHIGLSSDTAYHFTYTIAAQLGHVIMEHPQVTKAFHDISHQETTCKHKAQTTADADADERGASVTLDEERPLSAGTALSVNTDFNETADGQMLAELTLPYNALYIKDAVLASTNMHFNRSRSDSEALPADDFSFGKMDQKLLNFSGLLPESHARRQHQGPVCSRDDDVIPMMFPARGGSWAKTPHKPSTTEQIAPHHDSYRTVTLQYSRDQANVVKAQPKTEETKTRQKKRKLQRDELRVGHIDQQPHDLAVQLEKSHGVHAKNLTSLGEADSLKRSTIGRNVKSHVPRLANQFIIVDKDLLPQPQHRPDGLEVSKPPILHKFQTDGDEKVQLPLKRRKGLLPDGNRFNHKITTAADHSVEQLQCPERTMTKLGSRVDAYGLSSPTQRSQHSARPQQTSIASMSQPHENRPSPYTVDPNNWTEVYSGVQSLVIRTEQQISAALASQQSEMQLQLRRLAQENHVLHSQLETSTQENKVLLSTLEQSNVKLEVFETKYARLRRFVEGIGSDCNALRKMQNGANQRYSDLMNECEEYRSQRHTLAEEWSNRARESSKLTQHALDACREMQSKADDAEMKNQYLQSQLSERVGLLVEERDRCAVLQQELTRARSRDEAWMHQLNGVHEVVLERLTQLQASPRSHEPQRDYTAQLCEILDRIRGLKEANAADAERIFAATETVESNLTNHAEQQQLIGSLRSQIAACEVHSAGAEREVVELRAEFTQKLQDLRHLEQMNEALQGELHSLRERTQSFGERDLLVQEHQQEMDRRLQYTVENAEAYRAEVEARLQNEIRQAKNEKEQALRRVEREMESAKSLGRKLDEARQQHLTELTIMQAKLSEAGQQQKTERPESLSVCGPVPSAAQDADRDLRQECDSLCKENDYLEQKLDESKKKTEAQAEVLEETRALLRSAEGVIEDLRKKVQLEQESKTTTPSESTKAAVSQVKHQRKARKKVDRHDGAVSEPIAKALLVEERTKTPTKTPPIRSGSSEPSQVQSSGAMLVADSIDSIQQDHEPVSFAAFNAHISRSSVSRKGRRRMTQSARMSARFNAELQRV